MISLHRLTPCNTRPSSASTPARRRWASPSSAGAELVSLTACTRSATGTRPHDVIGQARRIVLAAIEEHGPQVVAIEEPLRAADQAGGDLCP